MKIATAINLICSYVERNSMLLFDAVIGCVVTFVAGVNIVRNIKEKNIPKPLL